MKPKTLIALLSSIEHWKDIRDGKCTSFQSCDLCQKFGGTPYCIGCPIYEKTGETGCNRTPYKDFIHFIKDNPSLYHSDKYKELAQKMLNFLVALIPKGEDMTPTEKQIEKLKEELEKLEKIVASEKLSKRWFPEEEEKYYSIELDGDRLCVDKYLTNHNPDCTKMHQMLGGIFKTEEKAQKEIKRLELKADIINQIDEANQGWVPDWEDDEHDKYFFESYDHEDEILDIDSNRIYQYNKYPAKNCEILESIVEKYGAKEVAEALDIV